MPRRKKYSTEELATAMRRHDGNYGDAARELGITEGNMRERVRNDPRVKSLWQVPGNQGHEPSDIELMVRKDPPLAPSHKEFLGALKENGKEEFMGELETMLRNPDNIEKLKVFQNLKGGIGQLMSNALDVTQKIAIRQNMALFEVGEKLRDDISSGMLDPEEEILRTKLFLQTTEQQGKFYDRLLHGLDLMIKMSEKDKAKDKKKPGFRPLKEMQSSDGATQED
jgi:hypothetical protein